MRRKAILVVSIALSISFMFFNQEMKAQKERSAIAVEHTWDLSHLYASEAEWKTAKDKLIPRLNEVESFKGTLTKSAQNLLSCLEYTNQISKEATLLYIYASMNANIDTRDMKYSGMEKELQQLFSDFSAKASFINPEILTVDWAVIDGFIKKEPKLEIYRKNLSDLFHEKEHTLSEKEERIMALSGLITGAPQSVYSTFSNAEMPNPKVTLSSGETVELNSSMYSKFRAMPNREDRILVFDAFWNNFKKYEGSFGEMLYGNIKADMFSARARNYSSCLEAALFPKNIPNDVYLSLVENVNKNLPAFHRYLAIKKRMLGVDTLRYLDLYAPVVKNVDLDYTYAQAQELILKAFEPLGTEYTSTVKKSFTDRWIDVYPSTGKMSGAYSNGAAYDIHPYILLNYNDKYDDVSTLAHELGHTMHSYFSNKNQPYPTSQYQIFVAEVASTFNEVLLFKEMMKTVTDQDVRLSLLMEWLDGFKGTLFRQTQFAEYELRIHEAAEKGQPLTGEFLSKTYKEIVDRYYGHQQGVCFVDDYIEMEWAFIPHFYYNFYVYQYSTSFTASISLAERVLNKEDKALEKYMTFLSAGGSDYPIELLKKAGVDMTSSVPFDKAIVAMNAVMDEIEKILDSKAKK